MTRTELEHIIRAVAAITNENELIVIGSQAILGQYPDAPKKLLVSEEADIYAPARPDLSDLIRRNTGRAEPVRDYVRVPGRRGRPWNRHSSERTERPADSDSERNTNGATGWCLECHDIAVAKYVAGREKDLR